jgi:hypothetical protein
MTDPERVVSIHQFNPFRVGSDGARHPWAVPTAIQLVPFGDFVCV